MSCFHWTPKSNGELLFHDRYHCTHSRFFTACTGVSVRLVAPNGAQHLGNSLQEIEIVGQKPKESDYDVWRENIQFPRDLLRDGGGWRVKGLNHKKYQNRFLCLQYYKICPVL